MSARKSAIRFTGRADRDLENILLYTQRTWGQAQRVTYRTTMAQAFELLREHPQVGQLRDDLFPGCRSIQVEQHIIYYHQPAVAEIEVLRILHHRQDAAGQIIAFRS